MIVPLGPAVPRVPDYPCQHPGCVRCLETAATARVSHEKICLRPPWGPLAPAAHSATPHNQKCSLEQCSTLTHVMKAVTDQTVYLTDEFLPSLDSSDADGSDEEDGTEDSSSAELSDEAAEINKKGQLSPSPRPPFFALQT